LREEKDMTVKTDQSLKTEVEETRQRSRQFAIFMRVVAVLAFALGLIGIGAGLAFGNTHLVELAALTFGLAIAAYVADTYLRADRFRAGVLAWMIGSGLALALLPAVTVGMLYVVAIGTLANMLLVVVFFTPRLRPRLAVAITGYILIAVAIELWLPRQRLNTLQDLPWLPLLLYPASISVMGLLINLFGQTMRSTVESARAYANQLEQSRAALQHQTSELRATTGELVTRTGELEKVNLELRGFSQQAQRRADLLATSALVTHTVSQMRNLDELLPRVTLLIGQAFGYYHVGVFILDELGRFAVLRAANSEGGQQMLARGHKVAVGSNEPAGAQDNPIATVIKTGQPHTMHYTVAGADAAQAGHPDLPDTRAEIILPLSTGEQTFGALDAHSTLEARFTEEDVAILSALADQIAIAIENARLFARTQAALQEAQEAQARYLRQEWERLLPTLQNISHEYRISGVPSVGEASLPEMLQAIKAGSPVTVDSVLQAGAERQTSASGDESPHYQGALAVPIKLRDQVIGVIDLHETDNPRRWSEDDVALVSEVADQAAQALENVRLFEQTQRQAQREQLVATIASRLRAASDVESVLRATVHEIRRALGASHGVIRLKTAEGQSKTNQA
jgi:GAF domain-containing protein